MGCIILPDVRARSDWVDHHSSITRRLHFAPAATLRHRWHRSSGYFLQDHKAKSAVPCSLTNHSTELSGACRRKANARWCLRLAADEAPCIPARKELLACLSKPTAHDTIALVVDFKKLFPGK